MWCLAYRSSLKNRALGSGVCIYTYLGGTPSVLELSVLSLSSGGTGGIPGWGGARGGGGGAPMSLRLQCACGFFAVPFCQGRQPSVWFSQTIPGVFPSQPSPCYARETQYPASSLPILRRKVYWLVVACPPLRCTRTLLWPCWPLWRQDTCLTVQAVPDLLVLP